MPYPKTGAARCYCQPKLGIETTHPARTSGEAIRDTKENEPGWPERIGAEGYAQHLLSISNPASGQDGFSSEGLHAPPSSTPATSISPSTTSNDDNGGPASANASLYVHNGAGTVAKAKCWKRRGSVILDEDSIKVFSRPVGPVEERRISSPSSSIEIIEAGVVEPVVVIFEEGNGDKEDGKGGLVRRDAGKGKRLKGEKLKGEKFWRRVLGRLGCL
jgi:hypothetical protein